MDSPITGPTSAAARAGERAAKNVIARAVAEIIGKLASLVLFAALARSTGQTGLGVFVLAFAFCQLATTPTGLGLDRFYLRHVARDHSRIDEFFNVVALKLTLAVPVVTISVIVVQLLGYDEEARLAVYVLMPGLLFDSLQRTVANIFTARERSDLIAVSIVVQRVGAAVVGIALLSSGYGVIAVAITYSAGAAGGFILGLALLGRSFGLPRLWAATSVWRSLTSRSLPFAAQDASGALLARLDTVILSLLATQAAVGRYGAAYRLLESTFFLSLSINGAFAAMYTYLERDTEPTVQAVFERSVRLSLAGLVPFALIFGILAEPLTKIFFGADFASAAEPLRLLAPVVVLMGLVYICSSLVVSRRSPKTMVVLTAGMVIANVALNLLLIPAYGDVGAAAAMLLTLTLATPIALLIAARTVGGLSWGPMLVTPALAGLAMAVVMAPLASSFVPALILGLASYAAAFVLIERVVNPGDLEFLTTMVRRRLSARVAG